MKLKLHTFSQGVIDVDQNHFLVHLSSQRNIFSIHIRNRLIEKTGRWSTEGIKNKRASKSWEGRRANNNGSHINTQRHWWRKQIDLLHKLQNRFSEPKWFFLGSIHKQTGMICCNENVGKKLDVKPAIFADCFQIAFSILFLLWKIKFTKAYQPPVFLVLISILLHYFGRRHKIRAPCLASQIFWIK